MADNNIPAVIDTAEALTAKLAAMRQAQRTFAAYTQEQVDRQVGIIASVCALLAGEDINVLNISQSVLQEYFVMVMLVDLSGCQTAITEISGRLDNIGREISFP